MQQFERPGLFRRLAAILYDTFLVLPMIMAVVAVATGIGVAITGDPGNQDYSATLPPPGWYSFSRLASSSASIATSGY